MNTSKFPIGSLVVGLLFVLVLWLANLAAAIYSGESGGTFGDTFGAVNSLFTGLAFVGLVVAISYQRAELQIVREERNDTRKLLGKQQELNEIQRDAIAKQIFDQNFMGYIQMIIDLRQGALVRHTSGRSALQEASTMSASHLNNPHLIIGASGTNIKQPQFECFPIVRLSVEIYNVVSLSQVLDLSERDEYLGRISALFDRELAHVTAFFALIFAEDKPDFLAAYCKLEIGELVEPALRKNVEAVLASR